MIIQKFPLTLVTWHEFSSLCCTQTQSSTHSDRTFSNNPQSYDSFPYGCFTWVLIYSELPCQQRLASWLTRLVRASSLRHSPHYIQLAVTILPSEFTACVLPSDMLSLPDTGITGLFWHSITSLVLVSRSYVQPYYMYSKTEKYLTSFVMQAPETTVQSPGALVSTVLVSKISLVLKLNL